MLRVLPPIIKPVNMQPDLLQDRFYVGGIARNSAIPLVLRQIARFCCPFFRTQVRGHWPSVNATIIII